MLYFYTDMPRKYVRKTEMAFDQEEVRNACNKNSFRGALCWKNVHFLYHIHLINFTILSR